jgi:hypothetical protein
LVFACSETSTSNFSPKTSSVFFLNPVYTP